MCCLTLRMTEIDSLKENDSERKPFFFLKNTATPEIYPLPLHDALPISVPRRDRRDDAGDAGEAAARAPGAEVPPPRRPRRAVGGRAGDCRHEHRSGRSGEGGEAARGDRKSTRLNSSHSQISYAVFCLEK